VLTGTSSGGTSSYKATLPPAAVVGTISQTLEARWDSRLHGLRDAPIYPQGWSIDYYAGGGTKLAQTPTTLAGWAQVSRVVATGSLTVEALDGERQALVSTVSAPIPVVAPVFSGGSAGDGWDVFFDPAYTRVFNIHHHHSPATVMCRNLADSTTCPGYPITLTTTSNRSTGRIDTLSNKLWQPTVAASGRFAWDCVDLTTSARCATPVVLSAHMARAAHYDMHIDPVVIGRKMYAIGFATGNVARITCLDMATGTECAGTALPQDGSPSASGLEAVGSRLYVLPSFNLNLDCYDSTTWARCPGSWPRTVSGIIGPVWGVRGADGVVHNICASDDCFALDGSAHTLPPNFAAYLAAHRVSAYTSSGFQYGKATSIGTRAVWATDTELLACWDMVTDAACSAGFPITVPKLYGPTLDPEDPDCVWTNGDDGIIRNFKISTATAGCGGGPPRISFKAWVSIPRLSCDPASRVYQYKSFRLVAPTPAQYTSATLTVKDSNGVPIPGWTDVPISSANQTVDLTTLPPAAAGDTPTFLVAATGFTDTSVVPVGEFRVTTGAPPQLCWDLSAPASPVCPTLPGLATDATAGVQSTTITAKGSFTTGSGTTPFTDQVMTATVDANPPNFTNCGGTLLTATVKSLLDGRPVPGATVYLLDGAGNPVLDPTFQPVSAVSAADGTVTFPVWAAGYTLKLSGTARYVPVTMTVTAGGSGTTVPSGGTLVSNIVTTAVSVAAHVDIVVSVDAVPPPAPVVTGPPAGLVACQATTPLAGTAEAGSTVVVKVNDQQACTVVASAQEQWSCDTTLPLGTSTVTVTATDADGNSSSPTTVSFTRRNDLEPPVITAPVGRVNGPGVTVAGTTQPAASVTVKDERGAVVCTATADSRGAWQCDGTFTMGTHRLTAEAEWSGCRGASSPHEVAVLLEAWYQGTSCASTGGGLPAPVLLLVLGAFLGLRRRRP
jgi:MYXO-CTERM domain-containing protein